MKKLLLSIFILFFAASFSFAQESKLPTFSGLFFGDYYYVVNHDNNNPVNPTSTYGSSGSLQKSMGAFDYRRIYLTADYDIAKDFSARFRLESDPSASDLANNKLSTMVKDAFINWKNVTDGGNIIIGLQGTPQINMAEGIFGYRPLEKTIEDLHGISSSRDLGVSFNQKFSDQFKAGLLIGNNSSNSVPSNKYKAAYLYLQFNPVKEFTILLNGQYNSAPNGKDNRVVDVILNYANSSFSLGGQYFANGVNDYTGTGNGPTLTRNGFSLNGWVAFTDNLRLVARFDNYVPITDATLKNKSYATSTQNLILGALDWTVEKNVHLMPNVEYVSYGLSGSTADVLARATFYINF
jgi:hypothetical protein